MNGTVLARLAAAIFLLIAIVVAIIELGRQGEEARASRPVGKRRSGTDPQRSCNAVRRSARPRLKTRPASMSGPRSAAAS